MKPKKTCLVLTIAMICVLALSLAACGTFRVTKNADRGGVDLDVSNIKDPGKPVYTNNIDKDIEDAWKEVADSGLIELIGGEVGGFEIPDGAEEDGEEAKEFISHIKEFGAAARIPEDSMKELCAVVKNNAEGIRGTLEVKTDPDDEGGSVVIKKAEAENAVKLYKKIYKEVVELAGRDAVGYGLYELITKSMVENAEKNLESSEALFDNDLRYVAVTYLDGSESGEEIGQLVQEMKTAFDSVNVDKWENGTEAEKKAELAKLSTVQEKYSISYVDELLQSKSNIESCRRRIDERKATVAKMNPASCVAIGRVVMKVADAAMDALTADVLKNPSAPVIADFLKDTIKKIDISDESWNKLIDIIVDLIKTISDEKDDAFASILEIVSMLKGNVKLALDTAVQAIECAENDDIEKLLSGNGEAGEINQFLAGMKIMNKLVNVKKSENVSKLIENILPKLDDMCKKQCENPDAVEKGPEADLEAVYAEIGKCATMSYLTEDTPSEETLNGYYDAEEKVADAFKAYIAHEAPYVHDAFFDAGEE